MKATVSPFPASRWTPVAISDHELLRPIASGSYGEVWLARNAVGTSRAVKIVRRDYFERVEDFEREFKGLQNFEPVSRSHDGFVDILQIGRQDDWFYYVMELADDGSESRLQPASGDEEPVRCNPLSPDRLKAGLQTYAPRTLRHDVRARGALTADEVISLGLGLASALAHLHAQGLVHRDVKPSNILFVGGVPKLADAGLVAAMDDARSLVGTTGYIAPEGPGTPQADIFALGKVLYEAAFGKDRQDFPQLPSDFASRPDHAHLLELNEIIARACAHDPRERYACAEEMRAEIELLEKGRSVKRKRMLQQRWAICKKAVPAMILTTVVAAAVLFSLRAHPDADLHSAIPEVDDLVAQGDQAGLSVVPDRLKQAWKDYSGAVDLDPKFAPACVGLFKVRMGQWAGLDDHPADAEANLRVAATELIKVAPNLAETKLASAFLKYLDGHLGAAVADAQQATKMRLATKAGAGLVHGVYGWFLLNAGSADDALRELLYAKQATPYDPRVLDGIGDVYFVKHQFPLAIKYYTNSIAQEPRQYWGYFGKGSVYEETGEFEKAIEQFELGDGMVGRTNVQTKLFYDNLREAVKRDHVHGYWDERLRQLLSDSPENHHDIAVALAHLGNMPEAYGRLEGASNEGRLEGLCWDQCWDHNNERFKRIAAKVGMKP